MCTETVRRNISVFKNIETHLSFSFHSTIRHHFGDLYYKIHYTIQNYKVHLHFNKKVNVFYLCKADIINYQNIAYWQQKT